MPEFISKLQYQNYEKGEFSDEKARNLQQTTELVKNFPWDTQRGVDVQLTAPSVTICGPYGDYLKVSVYYNDKFCAYYLDTDHHLFEYHAESLEDIYPLITDFFNGLTDTAKFERKLFHVGVIKHFENGNFNYSVKPAPVYLRIIFALVLFLGSLFTIVTVFLTDASIAPKLSLLLPVGILFTLMPYSVYLMIRYFIRCKNLLLVLSAGIDTFQFGTEGDMVEYKKSDISKINGFISSNGKKGSPIFDLMEIVFYDGLSITIPGMLIYPEDFVSKFPGRTINQKQRPMFKIAWDFAHGR